MLFKINQRKLKSDKKIKITYGLKTEHSMRYITLKTNSKNVDSGKTVGGSVALIK